MAIKFEDIVPAVEVVNTCHQCHWRGPCDFDSPVKLLPSIISYKHRLAVDNHSLSRPRLDGRRPQRQAPPCACIPGLHRPKYARYACAFGSPWIRYESPGPARAVSITSGLYHRNETKNNYSQPGHLTLAKLLLSRGVLSYALPPHLRTKFADKLERLQERQ